MSVMADKNTQLNGSTSPGVTTNAATSDDGQVHTTLLETTNKTSVTAGLEKQGQRRWSIMLFTVNAGCVIWLWMIGIAYTTGVVRTLERRFGLSSTQTGIMMASGDIVHTCIVVFVGYLGRRSHKPRIMCVMALFSAAGYFIMTLPHWLYNMDRTTSSVFVNDCMSCIVATDPSH